jgi:hypothetical protein
MSTDTNIYSWQQFKTEVAKLRENADGLSQFLFRGHGSDRWSLETTLQRSAHDEGVLSYYRLVLRIKAEVQAFTGREWSDVPEVPVLMEMLTAYDKFSLGFQREMPHYAYLAHLRHHGFPTPLLDWSSSPFVAAYFAFVDEIDAEENVSIYAYRERGPDNIKSGGSDVPSIRRLGPFVAGPKRHFAQRSQYTVCTHWNSGHPCFWSHDAVCQVFDPKAKFQQDIIYKFTLSGGDRDRVLKELDDFNLNAFTLFGSEESLMRTLSEREAIRQ